MKEFYGKQILTTLKELIDPTHAALVIVDIQNDECRIKDEAGNITYSTPEFCALVPRLKSLVDVARNAKVRIMYLQHTSLPDLINESPPRIRYLMKARGSDDPALVPMFDVEGTWGHKIIEEIAPEPGDFVIKKHRPSGFVGTNMDLILKNAGIKTLVFTGIVTEGCVESTVRSAVHHDYYVVIALDGVASKDKESHEGSLRWFAKHFEMPTVNELIAYWKA